MENVQHLGFQIRSLSHLIRRYVENKNEGYNIDKITAMHGWVIGYLYSHRDQDIFQRDIEKTFSVRRSTVTAMLQLMEKNDLIIREPVNYDGRLKKIILTEKAIKNHEIISNNIRAAEDALTRGLTDEEINTLGVLLAKVQDNLRGNVE